MTENKDESVFLLNPLMQNKLKKLINIEPIKVTLTGSILQPINISIKNKVKKFNIKVKKDFNPLAPPIIVIRINKIISSRSIIFIALYFLQSYVFLE